MIIRQRDAAEPFITKDGSTIRSLLDLTNAPVQNQSLAEATLAPGQATEPHYHARTEEIYYILSGEGEMTLAGETRSVVRGDAILIPPGAVHTIRNSGARDLVFLCCCAPPYAHEDTFPVSQA